jgi:hypothetical protein
VIRDGYTQRMRMAARPEEPLQDLLEITHDEQREITDRALERMAEDSKHLQGDTRGLRR